MANVENLPPSQNFVLRNMQLQKLYRPDKKKNSDNDLMMNPYKTHTRKTTFAKQMEHIKRMTTNKQSSMKLDTLESVDKMAQSAVKNRTLKLSDQGIVKDGVVTERKLGNYASRIQTREKLNRLKGHGS